MGKKAGKDFKLYKSTAALASADASTGTWAELTNVDNVTRNTDRAEFEANTRGNNGFKSYMSGLKDAKIEFSMVYDDTDADLQAIETAWDTDAAIGVADMDGPIATVGSKGIAGNWKVTRFNVEEPLDGPSKVNVTLSADSFTHLYEVTV